MNDKEKLLKSRHVWYIRAGFDCQSAVDEAAMLARCAKHTLSWRLVTCALTIKNSIIILEFNQKLHGAFIKLTNQILISIHNYERFLIF